MNLHELLRDLVARQGPSVVDSAEGFRAALDDFLTEDEATTGELNLLVDAVRLGGVERLHSIIEHGGEPGAAIAEAGDGFARDRGTDDVSRCRWAVGVVGYALGWVEAGDIPPTSVSVPPPAPPAPVPSAPSQPVASAPSPASPSDTSLPPQTFPQTETVHEPPTTPISVQLPAPPPGPPRRRTGRIVLVVLLVVAVLGGAVAASVWLNGGDDPGDDQATDGGSTGQGSSDIGDTIPVNSAVIPILGDNGDSRIYAVDVDTGDQVPLTSGPQDRVPSVSPDRGTLMYVVNGPGGGRARQMVLDLASRQTRPLLTDDSPCESGGRPGFNPAGDRVVLVCFDSDGDDAGTYVLDLRGRQVGTVPVPAGRELQGTPTWISDTTIVYSLAGATDDEPATLWQAEVDAPDAQQITVSEDGLSSTHPDWSAEADGSGLLLFSRHPVDDNFGDLITADAAQEAGPSTDGAQWEAPAWSPDGTRVLFDLHGEDGDVLAVAPLDDLTDVTPIPGIEGEFGVAAWGTR